jgi:alkane 1-monooxygenase
MGENIYAFMCREMPGAARRAWVLEAQRLRANGRPVWSMQNQILQPALMTLALWSGLAPWLGVAILLFLLHLQRHSDHHAHPLRCYQSLRHFEDLPQLPKGYFGMFVIAYLPPLRYWLMDRRLLEVVGRDPARINFHPAQRERLLREHGLEGAT